MERPESSKWWFQLPLLISLHSCRGGTRTIILGLVWACSLLLIQDGAGRTGESELSEAELVLGLL